MPGIVAAPASYVPYGSFFEQLSLVCWALALYSATAADRSRARKSSRASHLGLGVCAVSFTLSQIFYLHITADLAPGWIPPGRMFWAVGTTVAFALAALAILANRNARLAIRLMTVMLGLFGVLVWIPRLIAHPHAHSNWSELALTFLITGACWMVADSA